MAHHGFEDGYLEAIEVVWADVPTGRGPTGTAIREGRVVAGYDFANEGGLVPWKTEALRRGYASAAALPVSLQGETIGAISMYSGDAAPVGEEELHFLRQLADDVAFGVQALLQRAARVRADAGREARRSWPSSSQQDCFRALIEGSSDLTLVIDREGIIRFASPGVARGDLAGRPRSSTAARCSTTSTPTIIAGRSRRWRRCWPLPARPAGSRSASVARTARYALVESGLRNLLDAPGVGGIVVINRDVTEQNASGAAPAGPEAGERRPPGRRRRPRLQQPAHRHPRLRRDAAGGARGARGGPGDRARSRRAGERAGELTRQLLAFARKQVDRARSSSTSTTYAASEKMLRRVLGEDIRWS